MWHPGLKYKILNLGLPITIEKLLCSFLDHRTAQIKIKNHTGPQFPLNCGVPQGSVISPTLFIMYTSDIPPPTTGINIMYAYDVTQIIGYQGKSKSMIKRRAERAIEDLNRYEARWKIQTNITKFSPLALGSRNNPPLEINGNQTEYRNGGKVLGLKINNRGYYSHVTERKQQGERALKKLFRFRNLPTKIKVHLVKAMVIPTLEYPPIPIHSLSKNQIIKLQRTQNKALRWATEQRHPYTLSTVDIHELTNTPPTNIRLHKQAEEIWNKLRQDQNEIYTQLTLNTENITKYNMHFPSSLTRIHTPPNPIYT